jgi:glycosyltransferase involved in cell wall biosynthesis
MRRILGESDLVFAVTPAEQGFLHAQGLSRRVVVGGNGLRLGRFPYLDPHAARARLGLPQDAFVVLFLGRKTAYKGLDALLAALRALRAQHSSAHLLAIGPETPESQRLWNAAGDMPGLIVRGAVADEERLAALAACNVLAVPSRAEAFGIVYLEAWAYRKPVIAAALPAIASLIGEGEDGFLIDPDRPAQLHDRLLRLAEHPDEAAAMGERGYAKLAARYTVEAIGAIVEAAYARVLRHHRLTVEERPACSST